MSRRGKGTSRVISAEVTEETLRADLENYRQKAVELGASEAQIIPAEWVEVDERVRLKCAIPPCPNYGRCGYCPPNMPELDFMRKALGRYKWAVLFKNDVPVEDFADIGRYYPHGKKHQKKTDIEGHERPDNVFCLCVLSSGGPHGRGHLRVDQ